MYSIYTEEAPSLTTVSRCWKVWSFSGAVGQAPQKVSGYRWREKHLSFPFSIQTSCTGIELKHTDKPRISLRSLMCDSFMTVLSKFVFFITEMVTLLEQISDSQPTFLTLAN